jgi:hypothetical protein
VTPTSSTYSTSQYCASNKAYYYSKAYVCPPLASSTSPFPLNDDKEFKAALGAAFGASKNFLGAIIGGIVGGVVFIIILIVICCYCCCKK